MIFSRWCIFFHCWKSWTFDWTWTGFSSTTLWSASSETEKKKKLYLDFIMSHESRVILVHVRWIMWSLIRRNLARLCEIRLLNFSFSIDGSGSSSTVRSLRGSMKCLKVSKFVTIKCLSNDLPIYFGQFFPAYILL